MTHVGQIEVVKKVSDTPGIHSFVTEHDMETELGCLIEAITGVISESFARWIVDEGMSPTLLDGETMVIKLSFHVTEKSLDFDEDEDDDE